MTVRRTMPIVVSSFLLLAGCSFFSHSQSSFYSLERIPPSRPVVSVRGAPIGIDSVDLPPGFDRKEIVALKPDHQLDVRGTQQWSANLGELVLHTLAFDLAGRLPEGMVILPGEAKPSGPTRSIAVVFEELAAGPDAKVVLDARWIVKEAGRPDVTRHERITVNIASLDSANVASGMSQALAELADRIAAGVSAT
jgi:uncharacterized lipoprotein YmbA